MSFIGSLIPGQRSGSEKNFFQERTFLTEAAARAEYEIAKIRLLHVNRWHHTAGEISTVFFLFDAQGLLLNRPVQQGDYIRISIPGPGNKTGGGFDWVFVEDLREEANATGLRVRPCEAPQGGAVAHFLDQAATSTFAVWQDELKVYSGIFGRNESPNLADSGGLLQSLRNFVTGASAIAGAADLQWSALAKGLIRE